MKELRGEFERRRRGRRAGAPAMLDLDGFEAVNDRLGHRAGDQVLRECADALRRRARAGDVVARLGGDEFGILLPETDGAAAAGIAQALVAAVRRRVTLSDGRSTLITASAGVASLDDACHELALSGADEAMHCAKRLGGDRVVARVG